MFNMKAAFKIDWASYNKSWAKMDRKTRVSEAIRLIDEVEHQVDNMMANGDVISVCGSAEDCVQAYKALCESQMPGRLAIH